MPEDAKTKYKRILLKLSGEALAGDKQGGFDSGVLDAICESVKECAELGAQIGIVVGGGNLWRGRDHAGMDHNVADRVGMLATAMNALTLADTLEAHGVAARVQTAIQMPQIAQPYIAERAVRHMEKGRVAVFACGTGSPFFSTDTAASLRAAEIKADVIFKATMVDGVYDDDPNKNKDAVKYDRLTFTQILRDGLKVMDSTAASMCRDNNIPVLVFSLADPKNIARALLGEDIGTLVKEEM